MNFEYIISVQPYPLVVVGDLNACLVGDIKKAYFACVSSFLLVSPSLSA